MITTWEYKYYYLIYLVRETTSTQECTVPFCAAVFCVLFLPPSISLSLSLSSLSLSHPPYLFPIYEVLPQHSFYVLWGPLVNVLFF